MRESPALVTQFGALLSSSFARNCLLLDLHPDFGDAALYLEIHRIPIPFIRADRKYGAVGRRVSCRVSW